MGSFRFSLAALARGRARLLTSGVESLSEFDALALSLKRKLDELLPRLDAVHTTTDESDAASWSTREPPSPCSRLARRRRSRLSCVVPEYGGGRGAPTPTYARGIGIDAALLRTTRESARCRHQDGLGSLALTADDTWGPHPVDG